MNFYELLETDNIEEKVLKPNDPERTKEVVLLPEIPAQNKVENSNVEAASVDAMNEVINEYTSNDTEMNNADAKVPNYCKFSTKEKFK